MNATLTGANSTVASTRRNAYVPDGGKQNRRAESDNPFAALLAFTSDTGAKIQGQAQADAGQMFEPKTQDPQAARRARLQEEYGEPPSDAKVNVDSPDVRDGAPRGLSDSPAAKPGGAHASQHRAPPATGPDPQGSAPATPFATAALQPRDNPGADAGSQPLQLQSALGVAQVAGVTSQAVAAPRSNGVAIPFVSPGAASAAQQVGEILKAGIDSDAGRLSAAPARAADGPASPASRQTDSTKPRTAQSSAGTSSAEPQETQETKAASFGELIKSLRLQLGARQSTARLRLQPPELGHIRVDVKVLGDRVQIDVQTETDEARDLLARRANQLKSGLESHGIQLDRLDVVLNSPGGSSTAAVGTASAPAPRAEPSPDTKLASRGRDKEQRSPQGLNPRSGLHAALDARLDVNG